MDTLERFRSVFKGWISSLNRVKGFKVLPDEVLKRLESRIPEAKLRQIGAGFINGWLENEPEPRGYFVKESDRKGLRGGQWTVGHVGGGRVDPNWELHVQLADYCRIRTISERQGLTTRLEDRLMDIAVFAGKSLILYVENKEKKEDALDLLKKMKGYGNTGFGLSDPDVGNHPLRKAKYLVREGGHPRYFALSAIGFEKIFRVEYFEDRNRFLLHETDLSLIAPLFDAKAEGVPAPRSAIDPLALEFDRLVGDKIWVSPGSGATAYNFYLSFGGNEALFLGVYEDGRVWTNIEALGKENERLLAKELSKLGITLDTQYYPWWKKKSEMFNLHNEDPVEIATRVVAALFPGIADTLATLSA